MKPTSIVPLAACASDWAVRAASSRAATARRACTKNVSPSGVSVTPRAWRSSSLIPSSNELGDRVRQGRLSKMELYRGASHLSLFCDCDEVAQLSPLKRQLCLLGPVLRTAAPRVRRGGRMEPSTEWTSSAGRPPPLEGDPLSLLHRFRRTRQGRRPARRRGKGFPARRQELAGGAGTLPEPHRSKDD